LLLISKIKADFTNKLSIKSPTSTIALLVFSLSAKEEACHKRLIKTKNHANEAIFDLLIDKTAQLASRTCLDVIWMDESKQKGSTFSSRFTNAFEQLFAMGYKNVISIGNDSPGLEIKHLQRAIKNLENGKAVIGPSSDGGAYLIGLNRSQFRAAAFKNLPWQKEQLLSELSASIYVEDHSIFFLEELDDLDTAKDFFTYISQNPHSLLALTSNAYLEHNAGCFDIFCSYLLIPSHFSTGPLRAPPFHIAA